jgi:hypothetical protein
MEDIWEIRIKKKEAREIIVMFGDYFSCATWEKSFITDFSFLKYHFTVSMNLNRFEHTSIP